MRWSRKAVETKYRGSYQRHFARVLFEQFGRAWRPARLPPCVKRGAAHRCFYNALLLASQQPDLSYVEGHADFVEHAWCVNAKGHVLDPTWPEALGPHAKDYFGVAFDTTWVFKKRFIRRKVMKRWKMYRGSVIFSISHGNPALHAKPEEMLDPRWYNLKALKKDDRVLHRRSRREED
jgi:hypothetical protein